MLLEAWNRRPRRAEALHELARCFAESGDPGLAYLFADLGLQLGRDDRCPVRRPRRL